VRENIVRHVEMGKDHFRAAHEGTDEIGLAVAATTFSIVAVFVPIGFMYGLSGQWFKPFALTIACAVLVSLFVSFSLDPMLSAYWPDPEIEQHEHRSWISRKLVIFNQWFDAQAQRYTKVVGWALDHRMAMIALALVSFVGALALQGTFGGFGFVPVSDRSELTIQVEDPAGLQPRLHADQGGGGGTTRAGASRGPLHLHHDRVRWGDGSLRGARRGGSRLGLCASDPEEGAVALTGPVRGAPP